MCADRSLCQQAGGQVSGPKMLTAGVHGEIPDGTCVAMMIKAAVGRGGSRFRSCVVPERKRWNGNL